MVKYIFLIFTFITTNQSSAQPFKNYYDSIYKADSLVFVGMKSEALRLYTTTFSSVEHPYCKDVKNAYHLAIALNQFETAYLLGKQLLVQAGDFQLLTSKNKQFTKSHFYSQLKYHKDSLILVHQSKINDGFVKLLDSLTYVDQRIIRSNKSHKGNFDIPKEILPENLFDLDQQNFILLMSWIDSLGFPSEHLVGYRAYHEDVWVLLHHNLREPINLDYHKQVLDWIENGWYHPNDMMIWFEQYNQQQLKTTFFTTWDQNLSIENIDRINANRTKYHLKSLNAYRLEKSGRSMISKW